MVRPEHQNHFHWFHPGENYPDCKRESESVDDSDSSCSLCHQSSKFTAFHKNCQVKCFKCGGIGHVAKYVLIISGNNSDHQNPNSWRFNDCDRQESSPTCKSFTKNCDRDCANDSWRNRQLSKSSKNESQIMIQSSQNKKLD